MYELFYGLTSRPFRISPDLDCFCLSQSHKRALVHLRYGLQQAEGFVVLTGPSGMGKSLLVGLIRSELDRQNVNVANVTNSLIDDTDFLPAILSAFQKPIFEYQTRALISQLESFLLSKAKSGQRSVIIVDEAQNLSQRSLEILRLLSNLQYQSQAVLQIILAGDSALDEKISATENHQLRQRISLSYQMNPMLLEDTKKYILHRLTIAGWNNDPVIEDGVFNIIHSLSCGLPGKINRACDQLLMQAMLEKKHNISSEDASHLLALENQHFPAQLIEATESYSDLIIEAEPESALKDPVVVQETKTEETDAASEVTMINERPEVNEANLQSEKEQEVEQAGSKVMSTMLLSYAISILFALALFYANGLMPNEKFLMESTMSLTSQVSQNKINAVAIME